MSFVTNAILSYSVSENDEARLAEVNAFPGFAERNQQFFELDKEVGGSKFLERPTCVSAFNHINPVAMVEWIFTEPNWEHPEDVQVLVCDQDADRYTMFEYNCVTLIKMHAKKKEG